MTTLLVASTGGHLVEMLLLHERLTQIEPPFRWVTFDTPQSRSLMEDQDVEYVPFVGGREPRNIARNVRFASRIVRARDVKAIVSTGSSVALPYFCAGRLQRLPCYYIESAARTDAPSLTGRLMARVPGVALHTQYPSWSDSRWAFRGSVFDAFLPSDELPEVPDLRKLVVTLGTYRGFSFRRLVERLLTLLPASVDVLWQTGDTDASGLGIEAHDTLPAHELEAEMRRADLVISHAGVGSALSVFQIGRAPLLVPRRHAFGEHVDDHQAEIAADLSHRGLALAREVEELTMATLIQAARMTVQRVSPPPFQLVGAASTASG